MYEYKVIEVELPSDMETVMNGMAKKGWRVISVLRWSKFRTTMVITFEREKQQP